ncbi:MAG: NYN domain-containing protein [Candidatus Helarchaeota archaeon]
MSDLKILVDGSNVAFSTCKKLGRKRVAEFANIQLIKNFLRELGKKNPEISMEFFILCDSTLRYKIDNPSKLDICISLREVIQSPAGAKADDFLISYLIRNPIHTYIISNDTFREYLEQLKEITYSWRVPFMIFDRQILIPKLEEILRRMTDNSLVIPECKGQIQDNLMGKC